MPILTLPLLISSQSPADLPQCAVSTYDCLFFVHGFIRLRCVDDYSGYSKHVSVALAIYLPNVARPISVVSAKIRALSTASGAVYTASVPNLTCPVCLSRPSRMLFELWAMILTRGSRHQLCIESMWRVISPLNYPGKQAYLILLVLMHIVLQQRGRRSRNRQPHNLRNSFADRQFLVSKCRSVKLFSKFLLTALKLIPGLGNGAGTTTSGSISMSSSLSSTTTPAVTATAAGAGADGPGTNLMRDGVAIAGVAVMVMIL